MSKRLESHIIAPCDTLSKKKVFGASKLKELIG